METGQRYIIVLTGRLSERGDPASAAKILSKVYGIPAEKSRSLFNGESTPLRKKLDHHLAKKVHHVLKEAGVECSIEPVEDEDFTLMDLDAAYKEASKGFDHSDNDATLGRAQNTFRPSPPVQGAKNGEKSGLDESPTPREHSIPSVTDDDSSILISSSLAALSQGKNKQSDENSIVDVEAIKRREKENEIIEQETYIDEPQGIQEVLGTYLTLRLVFLIALLLLAIGATAYLYLFTDVDSPSPVVPAKSTAKTQGAIDLAKEQKERVLRESNVSFTELKLKTLAQSIRVWMMQFGGGYNPQQVTIPRLKVDMGISDDDLTDSWGTAVRYIPAESQFTLLSAGPDKKFESGDDISITQKR